LNLSNNQISDLTFGVVLSSCPKLRSLFLTKNTIEKLTKYRSVVSLLLPGLEMLDGTPIDTISAEKLSSSLMDDSHNELSLIREGIEEELRLDDTTFDRTVPERNDDSRKSSGPSPTKTPSCTFPDTGSDLTHGSAIVLAGNVAAAMRKRRVGGDSLTESSLVVEDSETTLDVLDSALRAKTPTTRTNSDKISFVVEGDITDILVVSPKTKPQPEMSPARPLSKSSAQAQPQNVSMSLENDSSAIRRPKTAFSGSSLRDSDNSYDHLVNRVNTPEKQRQEYTCVISPRQRNSSRPQSAAVSPEEVNSLFYERNLPFVVSRDEFLSFVNEDSDEDEHQRPNDINIKKEVKGMPQSNMFAKRCTGSLAHQNMVRRFKRNENNNSLSESQTTPSKLLKHSLPSIGDDFHISEGSNDEEGIAIAHSERLRFMVAEKDDTLAKMNKSRQATLRKLQGQVLDNCETMNADSSSSRKPIDDKMTAKKASAMSGASNVASSVEKKLGINLAGSLAAIDRWVQDVDSGEDESEAEQSRAVASTILRTETTVTDAGSARPPTGKEKILSRDAIFNLCWNTSEKRPDSRSSSRPSSSLRKESPIGSMADGSIASDIDTFHKVKTSDKNKTVDRRIVIADYAETMTSLTSKSLTPSISSAKPSHSQSKTPLPKPSESTAVHLSDQELIDLLRKPPKTVLALRTKASFQEFFRGIDMIRFTRLLNAAYSDISDLKDRESKISRRLSLMDCS
jgi:hypothetical protein